MKNEYIILGVDACKDGWIVAVIKEGKLKVEFYEHFADVTHAHELVDVLMIDIPLGLPDSTKEAKKRPEAEARKLLPKKASSVFTIPCKLAAEEPDYAVANKINKQVLGKGISKQSYYIMKKAIEVNHFLMNHPQWIKNVLESHPELQFAQLTETKLPFLASKKTVIGRKEREALLIDILQVELNIQVNVRDYPLYKRFPDDVVDAICLVVGARLGIEHGFQTIPRNPTSNQYGIPMKMTYYARGF